MPHSLYDQGRRDWREAMDEIVRRPVKRKKLHLSMCAACGQQLRDATGLCPHHVFVADTDWAAVNRIMCDFFHRQKPWERLPFTERIDLDEV